MAPKYKKIKEARLSSEEQLILRLKHNSVPKETLRRLSYLRRRLSFLRRRLSYQTLY